MSQPSQNKKRILHFIESEGVYGAERVILNLSTELQSKGQFEPVVGCIVPNGESHSALYNAAIELGVAALKIPIRNSRAPLDLLKTAALLKNHRVALIHSHGYKPSVYAALMYPFSKIKAISTCHLWFNPSKGPFKMRLMIRLEKFFYRWYPKVIAVSEPIKDILRHHIPEARIHVVPNGVEITSQNLPSESITELRSALSLDSGKFIILNSARLTEQKAQWVIIEAAALLKKQNLPVKFLIIGEGHLKENLLERISQHDLEGYVELLGFRADANNILAASDLFIMPSIDEGMPMALLEAAAAGKPIISTLVGDIGKLIVNESTGLAINTNNPAQLADNIVRIMEHPEFASTLGQNAQNLMQKTYSSQAMCQAYTAIYASVIK